MFKPIDYIVFTNLAANGKVEAIRDAVASFGPPGKEVPLASPATSEAIYFAIQQQTARQSPANQ